VQAALEIDCTRLGISGTSTSMCSGTMHSPGPVAPQIPRWTALVIPLMHIRFDQFAFIGVAGCKRYAGATFLYFLAHSTAKCNGEIFGAEENLTRSSVAEYLSGARVEFILDPLDIGMGHNREIGTPLGSTV
jgi:hypothetical protein